ncbi:lysozyme [Paenibacillus faecis]|uniref:Lysozyme n=1 Tax=Paenibacillus faecis TaxID=862114 RepID=A0A5D0CLV8_9BACL|nr:GPW/gp25 family protein [Paenibacillus faecis]TYA10936.1 lysozyme [Paenibacillus faecis]
MIYTVDMSGEGAWVNFSPASTAEEVGQNIRTIIGTSLGSAPGSREIGTDYTGLVDEPIPILRARLSGIITAAIMEQEPRARIVSIDFQETEEESALYGRLLPVIKYTLAEEATT